MTELQNNDLVSKLGAASPVEPTQASQINLSDSEEKVSANQAPLNEEPSVNATVSQGNIGVNVSVPVKDAANSVDTPPVDKPITEISNTEAVSSNNEPSSIHTDSPNTNAVATSPVATNTNIKTENLVSNNSTPNPVANNGAIAGNSVNKVVNADSQKVSSISKKNPKTEFWKGLASGVLISIGLVVIGLVLFDNGSLLTSVANSFGLTNDDKANEAVNIEDALAFGDSVSDSYVDDIMGNSGDEAIDTSEANDSELGVQSGEDENLNSDEVKEDESDLSGENGDDENLDEELDEDKSDLIIEKSGDDTKVVTKDDGEDSSSSTGKSDNNSSKNKLAGSIVSIFDDTEEDSEADELEDIDSLEKVPSISYKHVDKVEDANWVMSANCDNLHCGDISESNNIINIEDLVLCTEFRQSDKLDDNANRIGSNGICRYKDASELVYLELK